MSATHVLVSLVGGVALLLWGIQMIGTGFQRALGSNLRHFLAVGLRNRWSAVGVGLLVTGLLQSSTATAMMVTSFTAGGAIDLVPALAVMLGANIGTTLIVQLVSFDVSLLHAALIAAGVTAYRRGRRTIMRDIGTALVGIGLMLLALHLLVDTMKPVENSQALRDLLRAVTRDPLLNIMLAGILSWAAHSSVASMLFIMSLAGAGVITPEASLAMVLGANLGSALNPVIDGIGQDPTRLRVPIGNLITRAVGCALAVPLLPAATLWLSGVTVAPAKLAALFHILFNVTVAVIAFGLLPAMARLLVWMFPERISPSDPGTPRYLDEAALETPSIALSNAAREVLRMVDVIEAMLRESQDAFHRDDPDKVAAIGHMDDVVDRLYGALQRYLGAISREELSEEEARRLAEVHALSINLEHAGDIIDKNLTELAAKRIKSQHRLSAGSLAEIDTMHGRLLDHLQLAVAVFMYGDAQAARRLVAEKEQFREFERNATQRHLAVMGSGTQEDREASTLLLDITRDLKRIEAHIAATVYGLLEKSGDLKSSRLA
jgi:phosphate:Na+ symporter